MYDLPKTIFPALARARRLTVTAGPASVSPPVGRFGEVVDQVRECVRSTFAGGSPPSNAPPQREAEPPAPAMATPPPLPSRLTAYKKWPGVDRWMTEQLNGRGCMITYGAPPEEDRRPAGGRRQATLSLLLEAGQAAWLLGDYGPSRAVPQRLQLFADDAPIVDLPVNKIDRAELGPTAIAEEPVADSAVKALETMAAARTLRVVGGEVRISAPLDRFSEVFGQLSECLKEARASALPASTPQPQPQPGPTRPTTRPAPARPVQPPRASASLPSPARLSPRAVRGVEPVDAALVAGAVADFMRIHDRGGMIGAIDRSETCFTDFQRAPSWKGADRCLAFDEAASAFDAAVSEGLGVEPNEYFARKVLDSRTTDALGRLGGDHYVQDAHLRTLRVAARSALDDRVKAGQGSADGEAEPAGHRALKGRIPDTPDASDTAATGEDSDAPPQVLLGVRAFLQTWKGKDFAAVEALSRACYARQALHPGWHEAEPCFSLDEAAWVMADAAHHFRKTPVPGYFTRAAVDRRQDELARRTAEMQGKDPGVGLALLRDLVLQTLKDLADAPGDQSAGAAAGAD